MTLVRRCGLQLLIGLTSLMLWGSLAQAERRVALVIGNSGYADRLRLVNPRNDAEAMTQTLRQLNFDVLEGYDLNPARTQTILSTFRKELEGADVGLFYYAGHGLQVAGRNYLIPVNVPMREEKDLERTLSLDAVMNELEREQRINLLFLDACRDNPFTQQLGGRVVQRSMGETNGLAAVRRGASGTLIAFATSPGSTADDGKGKHSPFAAALLRYLPEPGLEVNALMNKVRKEVYDATGGVQRPWSETSLLDDFYFKPNPRADVSDSEGEVWIKAERSGKPEPLIAYLRRFPDGAHAAEAKSRLDKLSAANAAPEGQDSSPPPDDLDRAAARLLAQMPPVAKLITGGFTYASTRVPTSCGWHLAEQVGAALGGQIVIAASEMAALGAAARSNSEEARSLDGSLRLPVGERAWLLEGSYTPQDEAVRLTFELIGRDPKGKRRSYSSGAVLLVPEHGSQCRGEAPPRPSPLTQDETRGTLDLELTSPFGSTPVYEVRQPPVAVELELWVNAPAHLYCFDRGTRGIQKLLPNSYRPDTLVQGGQVLRVPTDLRPTALREQQMYWYATEPDLEIVKCFASDQPLQLPAALADTSRPPAIIPGLSDEALLQAMRGAAKGGALAEASVILKIQ